MQPSPWAMRPPTPLLPTEEAPEMERGTPGGALRLQVAVDSAPSGLLMVDARGRIVLVNREIERLFGYPRDELLGESVDLLVPEAFRENHARFRDTFLGDAQTRAMGAGRDLYGKRKDGTEVPVEIGLNPLETEEGMFVLASVVDITQRKQHERERRELERQLRQAQKLEAVGTLAGGIAHDFNNILGAIMGFSELLRDAVQGEQARRDLEEITGFVLRGKELVQRIQAFGGRREGVARALAPAALFSELEGLVRASFPPNIEILTRIHPDSGQVMAEPAGMRQALMNLAVNAAQAMPRGGQLRMEADPVYITDSRARAHPHLREGRHVLLTIADTGEGIPPELQARVLEPFFTTRPAGRGSGLGLAIVHRVVHENAGALEFESFPGEGTTFRIILPSADLSGVLEGAAHTPDEPRGRGERILYVEDEPGLAEAGRRRLEALGYRVTVALDAEAALERFRDSPDGIDAVVSDYLMPGMNGSMLASALARIRPGVPVILLTGFVEEMSDEEFQSMGVTEVLRKPTTRMELAEALARVLGRSDRH